MTTTPEREAPWPAWRFGTVAEARDDYELLRVATVCDGDRLTIRKNTTH